MRGTGFTHVRTADGCCDCELVQHAWRSRLVNIPFQHHVRWDHAPYMRYSRVYWRVIALLEAHGEQRDEPDPMKLPANLKEDM